MRLFDRYNRLTALAVKAGWEETGASRARHESWRVAWETAGYYVLAFYREGSMVLYREYTRLDDARRAVNLFLQHGKVPE